MQQNTHHGSQDLTGEPEFVEVKKLVKSINDQESNTLLKQSDEAINPKKGLLNLYEIIHLQLKD